VLKLQNTILEMVAKGETLEATADRLCTEVENRVSGIVCSILRVDRSGLLHPLASPSLPDAYSSALEGVAIGPRVGSCGSAAYLRMPIAVTDIESDPRWEKFNALPLQLGLKACWSSPISDGRGNVVGTFAFYYREKRGPSELDQRVVDTCVNLCAIAFERHERVLERERRSFVDALTELSNRACFNATLSRLPCDEPGSWALLLLDLDNLKIANDTFGHHAGDILLQTVAVRIARAAAPHIAFRIGGDEFAVLVQGSDAVSHIEAIVKAILDAVAQPADCAGHVIVPTATIGVAALLPGDPNAEAVRQNADVALYHAKEGTRGGFIRYAPRLSTTMTYRVDAIRDVAAALGEGRIDAYYQPVVRFDTRAIVGLEALFRLITKSGEVLPAAAFQEATSDARIALQLTRRMFTLVAADIRRWLDMGVAFQHVGINVSSADFYSGTLNDQLMETFQGENVSLEHVILEVSESVYMRQNDHVVARAIKEMRARGLRVALDDFGTSFASLTHLLTVPVDIIKIDKSFIDLLAPGDASSIIVEGLLGIAHKLGIRVVAKGVETESQASQLSGFGCVLAQGYLFSKPVHRDGATALLMARKPIDAAIPSLRAELWSAPQAIVAA
jgi:diguanylate cyclase (GGDEF)-like protein